MELLTILHRVAAHLHRYAKAALPVAACLMLSPVVGAAADAESLEYTVKAAYLYKFGIYVEWPAAAFAASSSELVLCVAGDDPFGTNLDKVVSGQHIDSHPIVIRRLKMVNRDSGCHILYIGASEGSRIAQIVETLRGANVLTISDVHGNEAGIIHFLVKDNRVRFNIDDEAAAQNGLIISSKLLGLALNVKLRVPKEAH